VFVGEDEERLRLALEAARPGDVLGLDGYLEVTEDVWVETEDLTLTCATPESGLYAEPGAGVEWVLQVVADRVTVDRLVLDGSDAFGPFTAWTGSEYSARDVRFTNNTVTCGSGECAYFWATPSAVIEGNYFESHGSWTGVHVQRGLVDGVAVYIDGTRIEGNTIIATAPSFHEMQWGGIRVLGGDNLVISNNIVRGPWTNSIHMTQVSNSQFKGNKLEGARLDGILMLVLPNDPSQWSWDNVIRNNRITAAGETGIYADGGCLNTFFGNNLNGNANDLGAVFASAMGANTLVGNKNIVNDWEDNEDCDGDDVVDPNIITGKGAVLHGVRLGEKVSEAASSWNDMK
jgi:hypothetical protein